MAKFTTAELEYSKYKNLKKEDVVAVQKWMEKQPHLPKISELQTMMFLHSNYNRIEATKQTIENFYTVRTHCPEVFGKSLSELKPKLDLILSAVLPDKTSEGYTVMLGKLLDTNPSNFDFNIALKMFDAVCQVSFAQLGCLEGHILIVDAAGLSLGHVLKININVAKKYLFYVQEGLPIRLKAVHILNSSSVIEKLVNMVRPFIKNEIFDLVKFHTDLESFNKYIPKSFLPKEYGGNCATTEELHNIQKDKLLLNSEFISDFDKLLVNESKRAGKSKYLDEVMGAGMEGSFKKLSFD